MITLDINGNPTSALEGVSLTEILKPSGMRFPCGGMGKCGKCRIHCKELEPTALDARFLSERQILDGIRLSCDKTAKEGIKVRFEAATEQAVAVKLSECSIIVEIGVQTIRIGILGGEELVDTVSVENPLNGEELPTLPERYARDRNTLSKALRAVIGRECVELFERYGAAKANTLSVAGNGMFLKILMELPLTTEGDLNGILDGDTLSLPAESVYLLPVLSNLVGGDVLATLVTLPDECIYLDAESLITIASIRTEDTLLSTLYVGEYGETELKGLKAAIQFFLHDAEKTPPVYLSGRYRDKLVPVLDTLDVTYFMKEREMHNLAAALNNRTRAKIRKEAQRATVISLGDSDLFQSYLTDA